jgi:hypothetical protein
MIGDAHMRTIDQMIQSEVLVCLSSLVSTLARGVEQCADKDVNGLAEQAFELACPVPDYEEAVIQDGWEAFTDQFGVACWRYISSGGTWAGTAEDVCIAHDIEPYDREVFEHWAVTDWLADKLIAAGEKVDKDFAGMCVWARTTTGQGIAQDYVVQCIYRDTMEA